MKTKIENGVKALCPSVLCRKTSKGDEAFIQIPKQIHTWWRNKENQA